MSSIKAKEFKEETSVPFIDDFNLIVKYFDDKFANTPIPVEKKGFWKNIKWQMDVAKQNIYKKSIRKEISEIKSLITEHTDNLAEHQQKFIVSETLNLVKKRNMLDIKGWQREMQDKSKPHMTFMVNMELRNGMHTHFMVLLKGAYFDYEDGRYIIDQDFKYYDVASRIYCLDYHQDCAIPLRRNFNIDAIMKEIKESDIPEVMDVETSINPINLKTFMESDIIQKVMKGAEMENWIKFVKLMLIIITVITSIILIIMLKMLTGK